jgi:hypothetical protein
VDTVYVVETKVGSEIIFLVMERFRSRRPGVCLSSVPWVVIVADELEIPGEHSRIGGVDWAEWTEYGVRGDGLVESDADDDDGSPFVCSGCSGLLSK